MIDIEERFDTIEEMEAFMKQIMPRSIYNDVEALQQEVAELKSKIEDSGWKALPLSDGVFEQNSSLYPCRYRKIGNVVYVEGCVKGFAEVEKIIATLPEGYRPSKEYYYQDVAPAGKTDTFRFFTNGNIQRMATTTPSPSENNYHFITTSFLVN